ncbi:MgtC/SapB family protein [Phenylobacterium sp. J426]|uniref:MgtC/SapB family protein n=1 Tax=Phenylobacterium sp. J426 TaxID=2898439 RepID=UPI0021511F9B|nr:MgtC/SapB family protein [Phenylobacterium sp. J426]MCR5874464.1 MgtC/SapB family protein [Phenylobacterium sp. J426]
MDMTLPVTDYLFPLLGAGLAGIMIGLEREARGHPAGLRTHTLVCLASALLMLAAVHQTEWMGTTSSDVIRIDPVRMAHGILTGIGFLCGGVIFRQGLSVHGLTTAASLWVTSALGTLYGVSFFGLAIIGTLATLIILVGFRWIDEHMPASNIIDVTVRYRRDGVFPEDDFHALMTRLKLKPRSVRHKLVGAGGAIELGATLRGPSTVQTRALAEALCDDGRVLRFEIVPRND